MSLSPLPLSYCTNVHPGRSLAEVEGMLDRYTVPVQRSLGRPVGAGLWLAQPVVREMLAEPIRVADLAAKLRNRALTCYTLNAFPFGDFHQDRVKEQVYLPDWTDPQRTQYTCECAKILATLLGDESEGSISTLPLSFKRFQHEGNVLGTCRAQLLQVAAVLDKIYQATGKTIRLAIEPEPFCVIETVSEAISFFSSLFRVGEQLGLAEVMRRHIGICYDVCHQAVEFEDIPEGIRALDAAGIRINKVQISCAIELADPANRETLRPYIEPRYLHQTMARGRDGTIAKAVDLNEALLSDPPTDFAAAMPWRVHFHVPVGVERIGELGTTRAAIPQALEAIAKLSYAPHLEVETYTWDVLPGAKIDLVAGITEELRATHRMIKGVVA